jgi:hypothetical protein
LLLIGAKHGANAALLVSRMLGLKNPEDFTPEAQDPMSPAGRRSALPIRKARSGANFRYANCWPITIL